MISREDVEHVAALARLGLTDEEIDLMQGQLNRILEAVGQLQAVDTSSVGPTATGHRSSRTSCATTSRGPPCPARPPLANAPLREGPLLRVPVVLEEGR